MQKKPNPSTDGAELRRRAETRLRERQPETGPARTDADAHRLVHELAVHQIELEMQNEELERARNELEKGFEKYCDLYDFAPVGYLTLDRAGMIHEANLAAASLLGIERSRLIRRRLASSVSPLDLPLFTAFLRKVFESKSRQFCELSLLKGGKVSTDWKLDT